MTDAEGKVQNLNVVNIFGSGSVTDYGDYTGVKMLTTNDPITQNGDEITFTTDAERVILSGNAWKTGKFHRISRFVIHWMERLSHRMNWAVRAVSWKFASP